MIGAPMRAATLRPRHQADAPRYRVGIASLIIAAHAALLVWGWSAALLAPKSERSDTPRVVMAWLGVERPATAKPAQEPRSSAAPDGPAPQPAQIPRPRTLAAPAVHMAATDTSTPEPAAGFTTLAADHLAPAPSAELASGRPAPAPAETTAMAIAQPAAPTIATAPRRQAPDHAGCAQVPHPAALRERGIEGVVQLRVQVAADGRALQVQILGSSGWRLFDEAALAKARGCRFRPAYDGDVAVEAWVEFPVRFALAQS